MRAQSANGQKAWGCGDVGMWGIAARARPADDAEWTHLPTTPRPHRLRTIRPSERQQVSKEPIRARHARRQLPEEAQSRVHVRPLPEPGHEQPALERGPAGIVG